jgi:hypothetical protein
MHIRTSTIAAIGSLLLGGLVSQAPSAEVILPAYGTVAPPRVNETPDGRVLSLTAGFDGALSVAPILEQLTLGPEDYLLIAGKNSGDWEIITAADLDGSNRIETRPITGSWITIDLYTPSASPSASLTLSSMRLTFESDTVEHYYRALIDSIYFSGPLKDTSTVPEALGLAQSRVAAPEAKVIYGEDNRREPYQVASAALRSLSRSTAGVVQRSRLTANGSNWNVTTNPWTNAGGGTLCADEPYRGQPVAPYCSAFLVGPDLVVTAGHCISTSSACSGSAFIFDWSMQGDGVNPINPVPASRVYFCSQVIAAQNSGERDYALLRLDRPVEGITPLAIRRQAEIGLNEPLVVMGHPAGIPLKIADGAVVKDARPGLLYFDANLDTYGGNSGSAVFNLNTLQVEGILVRGATDYRSRPGEGCTESNRVPDTGNTGGGLRFEQVSRMNPLLDLIPVITSSKGELRFDRARYALGVPATITLLDADLSGQSFASIQLSGPGFGPLAITLNPTVTLPGEFRGVVDLAPLELEDGDEITAAYEDAFDGTGPATVTVTASVDYSPPTLLARTAQPIRSREATLRLTASEPVRFTVDASETACGAAGLTFSTSGYSQTATIRMTGLTAGTSYHHRIRLEDEAGNITLATGEAGCFTFTTRTGHESFGRVFVTGTWPATLQNRSLTFFPAETASGYTATNDAATALPVPFSDTSTTVTLADDASVMISLQEGRSINFNGVTYPSVHMASNGSITFGNGDSQYLVTDANFHLFPRVTAGFADLDPTKGGRIWHQQLADRFVATWENVPFYSNTTPTNFTTQQVELFFDGRIRLTILASNPPAAVGLGLSYGQGIPGLAYTDNFTNLPPGVTDAPVYTADFATGPDGWELSTVGTYTAPTVGHQPGALLLQTAGSTNVLGFLDRVLTNPFADGDRLFRARFRVASDLVDQKVAPVLRFRLASNTFEETHILQSTSVPPAAFSPGMAPLEYTLLAALPAGSTQPRLSFDVQQVNPLDAASFQLQLLSAVVDSLPVSALPEGELNTGWEKAQLSEWEPVTLPSAFNPAILTKSNEGLTLRGAVAGQEYPKQATVGFFTSPVVSGLQLREGAIYRVDFTVAGGSEPGAEHLPGVLRLRVNSTSHQLSAMLNIDPNLTLPSLAEIGSTRTWSLYFLAPAGLANEGLLISADYIYSPDKPHDPTLPITIQGVQVFRHNRPW